MEAGQLGSQISIPAIPSATLPYIAIHVLPPQAPLYNNAWGWLSNAWKQVVRKMELARAGLLKHDSNFTWTSYETSHLKVK